MSDPAIRIENLGKKYIIDRQQQQQYATLRDTIVSGVRNLFKPVVDRQLKPNNTSHQEEFWALKDVSFEINQGDRVGIIGRNGAGKSTLLKILSRITEPTCGSIRIKGKVASLLEVGTGFHPELTGRENIFLNGAILGMNKIEIARKFDEIVDFAEVEKFLDTPVKRYSSGMYVRLAFAVAAHLEPEILIVDEVLAVGDIQFQKKCLGKMQDVSTNECRTVIFVSHNSDAIQRLCSQCMVLERGRLIEYDDTNIVMAHYLSSNFERALANEWISLDRTPRIGTRIAYFEAVKYSSLQEHIAFNAHSRGPLEFILKIESETALAVGSLAVTLYNQSGLRLVNADTISIGRVIDLHKGCNLVKITIERLYLNPGIYIVGLWLSKSLGGDWVEGEVLDFIESAFEIEVISIQDEVLGKKPQVDTMVCCDFEVYSIE
jgi:lipopolysaccharide transport system ATP-binding protein